MASIRPLAGALAAITLFALTTGCAKQAMPLVPQGAHAVALEAQRAYKIEDLLGIGSTYGEKLREVGITNTDKLFDASKTRYKRQKLAEQTGIPYKRIMAFAQKAALMEITGVGVRQSNLLQAVGIESVTELARRDPAKLTERMGIANTFKPKFVDNTPSLNTIVKWVAEAKQLAKGFEAEE